MRPGTHSLGRGCKPACTLVRSLDALRWRRRPSRAHARRASALGLALLLAACGRGGERDVEPPANQPAPVADANAAAADTHGGARTGGAGVPTAWGLEPRRGDAPAAGVATLVSVRTARHAGFDRVVFEFDDALPGYTVAWARDTVRECGSGHAVQLPGAAALTVQFTPARAHDHVGRATIDDRDREPGLPSLLRLRTTCDFEAHLEWVAALREQRPFAVRTLARPDRLVVDVRH